MREGVPLSGSSDGPTAADSAPVGEGRAINYREEKANRRCHRQGCSTRGEDVKLRCSVCGTPFCSEGCQRVAWKEGHKRECSSIKKKMQHIVEKQLEKCAGEVAKRQT